LIDVALACEDANSKLVEVVTIADVDDENCFEDSFIQIRKLKFGHKAEFCSDFEHKHKLKFRQDFEAGVCSDFDADVL